MALHGKNRLAAHRTVAEALRLTWVLRVPYVILTVLFTIPNIAITELGLYEPLNDFTAQAQSADSTEILAKFPFGASFLALVIGFAMLSGFGIFWYRYLLLGPTGALKFRAGQFLGMLGRFCGYGLLVMTVGIIAMIFVTLFACLLGKGVSALIGTSGTLWEYVIVFAFVGMAYIWPLSFAARTSLVFPSIALGRSDAISDSWAASKESEESLLWAMIVAAVPLILLSAGIYSVFSAVLGADLLVGATVSKGVYWWVDLVLSPVANLFLAVILGVVAIGYRDLTTHEPVPGVAETTAPATQFTA